MTFDRQLSFHSHLRNVSSKANQRLHFFKKVAPLLNVPGKLAVYKGFVHPTMEYSCLVWMGASDTSLRQLDRVQRRALHLIGAGTYLPRLSHRRAVASLCYIYKLHYLANSHPLAAMLPPAGATHTRPTRQSATERHHYQLLSTNPAHTSLRHLRGFPYSSLARWNSLPLPSFSILLIGIALRPLRSTSTDTFCTHPGLQQLTVCEIKAIQQLPVLLG